MQMLTFDRGEKNEFAKKFQIFASSVNERKKDEKIFRRKMSFHRLKSGKVRGTDSKEEKMKNGVNFC